MSLSAVQRHSPDTKVDRFARDRAGGGTLPGADHTAGLSRGHSARSTGHCRSSSGRCAGGHRPSRSYETGPADWSPATNGQLVLWVRFARLRGEAFKVRVSLRRPWGERTGGAKLDAINLDVERIRADVLCQSVDASACAVSARRQREQSQGSQDACRAELGQFHPHLFPG